MRVSSIFITMVGKARSGRSAKVSKVDWCLAAIRRRTGRDVFASADFDPDAGQDAEKKSDTARPGLRVAH